MSSKDQDLKPCPFCGKDPVVTKHYKYDEFRLIHRCNVMGAITLDWASEENIIARWNTRSENV